ncbi:DUF305 domain-containing protein [Micromonospora globbae]|uniref:DUF305 domain-containing protein n=1 Tax=Micromonospora globbae TaxID=1894969 RepID=UPI0037BC890D
MERTFPTPAPTPTTEQPSTPARRRWWPLAAAAIAVFALGLAVGMLVPSARTPGETSAEAGFARDMATHHVQAVEMAMIAHGASGNPEITTMAMDIALTQQAQIGIMRTWLTQWGLPPTGSQPAMAWMRDRSGMAGMDHGDSPTPAAPMPDMATKEEVSRLRGMTGQNLDIKFAELMIRHHKGGITMLDAVLDADPRPEVRELATRMRAGQQAEITALESLLERLHASSAVNASND